MPISDDTAKMTPQEKTERKWLQNGKKKIEQFKFFEWFWMIDLPKGLLVLGWTSEGIYTIYMHVHDCIRWQQKIQQASQ